MANQEHLKILKQGVEVWNTWRKEHPDIKPDLKEADLYEANLEGADLRDANLERADLRYANLTDANLERANLADANLRGVDPRGANLRGAVLKNVNLANRNLVDADLRGADLTGVVLYHTNLIDANLEHANLTNAKYLERANLERTNLRGAVLKNVDLSNTDLSNRDLTGVNLTGADLTGANLIHTNLSNATITGVNLYGTTRDNWIIDGITCDYVFLDEKPYFIDEERKKQWELEHKEKWGKWGEDGMPYFMYEKSFFIDEKQKRQWELEQKKQWELDHRVPKDRDFRPGEFEELYKQLPTFEYYFEHGFTALDAVLMSRIVEAINEKHPEFELDLVSFDKRGQPHATFTVLHKEVVEEALKQVTVEYEAKIKALEAERNLLDKFLTLAIKEPRTVINRLAIVEKGEITMGDTHIGRDNIEIKGHAQVKNLTTGASYHGVKPDDIEQLTTREDLQHRYQVLNDKLSDLRKAYIAEKDPTTRLHVKKQIEEAEIALKQVEQRLEILDTQQDVALSIVELIQSLPNLYDSESQRAFISSAGIDTDAQDQIPFGKPPAQFVPLLVSTLTKYGTLHDGRHALEAVLEAAKHYIGQEKRARCDELLQKVQTCFERNP